MKVNSHKFLAQSLSQSIIPKTKTNNVQYKNNTKLMQIRNI